MDPDMGGETFHRLPSNTAGCILLEKAMFHKPLDE
jgi:hypothetical protein